MEIKKRIIDLYDRIPRRHNPDNVKEMNGILDEYEDVLRDIEGQAAFEKIVAPYFDELEPIRELVKSSSLNKHSKQMKDKLFDEASGALKDTMDSVNEIL